MKQIFTFLFILISSFIYSQERNYVLFPCDTVTLNINEEVSSIEWQINSNGTDWSILSNGENIISINGDEFNGTIFIRAKMVLKQDSCIDYSEVFKARFVNSINDVQLKDFYDGYVFSSNNDSLLVGNIHGQFERFPWGCNNTKIFAGNSEGSDSGLENTRMFLEKCNDTLSAFRIIDQYYMHPDNIFIPSLKELALFEEVILSQDDRNGSFWSSNERNNYLAYLHRLNSEGTTNTDKVSTKNIISGKLITSSICQNFQVDLDIRERVNTTELVFQRDSIFTNVFISNSDLSLDSNYNYSWDWGYSYSHDTDLDNKITLEYKWNNFTGWHDYIAVGDPNTRCETEFVSNTIKPEFFSKSQSLRSISKGDLSLADFDADGQEDIVIAQSGILIYANDIGQFNNILTIPDSLHEPIVIAPDINNDGLADILIMGSVEGSPEVHSYLNMGEFQFQEFDNPFIGRLSGDLENIDLNNDGILEILISGMDQDSVLSFEIYSYDKSTDEYEIIPSTVPGLFNCEFVVEDIDGDDDSDLLIIGKNLEGRNTLIFRNEEGVLTEIKNDIIALSDGDVAFFHFNDDEYLDLAVTGEKADVIVEIDGNSLNVDTRPAATFNIYTQDSSNQFTLVQAHEKYTFYNSALDIGDYDSDGDIDLFISGGVDLQWCSKGIGGGTPPLYSRSLTRIYNKNNGGAFTRLKADINIGFGPTPNYASLAPGQFESKNIATSDFDGDFKVDFIRGGNGQDGLFSDVFLNTSSCSNLPPSKPSSIIVIDSCNHITLSWIKSDDDHTIYGINYQYYLKQVESETYLFSPANKHSTYNHSVFFKDLPNGEYVFGVKAIDGSKISSPYSEEYTFTIESPQTPEISILDNIICSENPNGNYIWYLNGNVIPGETANCIEPTLDGDYYCVSIEDGCSSDTSNVINYISTSVHDDEADMTIKIYPNPSTGVFQILSEIKLKRIEVYNALGQSVFKTDFNQTLDLSWLAKGLYVLSFDGTIQRTIMIQ